jgi:Protein of unknown function (DUF2867)
MTIRNRTVRAVAVPPSPMAERTLARVDYADAFAVALPEGAPRDPEQLARRVLEWPPPLWVRSAMAIRNAVVLPLGLKAPRSACEGFPLLDRDEREIVLGLDDRHLDFRASILVEGDTVVVSTRVRFNNALGRAYFAPVRIAHPFVVKAMMRRLLTSTRCPSSSPAAAG